MLKAIGFIVGGIVVTLLFNYIYTIVKQRLADKAKEAVGNLTGVPYEAMPLAQKLKHDLSPSKFLSSYLRLIPAIILVAGVVFAYGFWKGSTGKPVQFNLDYDSEISIPIPGDGIVLHKPAKSNELEWMDRHTGKVLQKVSVKDIAALKKVLRPYGFQLKPILVEGVGVGHKTSAEIGTGLSLVKLWDWRVEAFVTNKGAYVGPAYKLNKFIKWANNSFIGAAVGRGYHGDARIIIKLSHEW